MGIRTRRTRGPGQGRRPGGVQRRAADRESRPGRIRPHLRSRGRRSGVSQERTACAGPRRLDAAVSRISSLLSLAPAPLARVHLAGGGLERVIARQKDQKRSPKGDVVATPSKHGRCQLTTRGATGASAARSRHAGSPRMGRPRHRSARPPIFSAIFPRQDFATDMALGVGATSCCTIRSRLSKGAYIFEVPQRTASVRCSRRYIMRSQKHKIRTTLRDKSPHCAECARRRHFRSRPPAWVRGVSRSYPDENR